MATRLSKLFAILSIAVMFASGAHAAEVKGNVKTDVKMGALIQGNLGVGNKNTASVGSIKGKGTVQGSQSTTVRTGAVVQGNVGIGGNSDVNVGNIKNK